VILPACGQPVSDNEAAKIKANWKEPGNFTSPTLF
jgi:hypothetical protein